MFEYFQNIMLNVNNFNVLFQNLLDIINVETVECMVILYQSFMYTSHETCNSDLGFNKKAQYYLI